jgi:hypothetical protein
MRRLFLPALLTILTACARPAKPADPVEESPPKAATAVTPQESDWKAIEQLDAQAKSIARTAGCSSSSDCRTIPVGSRACGGPRYYIPYCSKTTDSAALFKKAADIANAEQAYNKKYQLASTCELRMAPLVESAGGACVVR